MPMRAIYGTQNGCALTPEGGIPTFTIRIEPAPKTDRLMPQQETLK